MEIQKVFEFVLIVNINEIKNYKCVQKLLLSLQYIVFVDKIIITAYSQVI